MLERGFEQFQAVNHPNDDRASETTRNRSDIAEEV
jgi:hypothetical protein